MNLQDCIKFATENPVCFVATAEGNQPRVRVIALWFANENGFYWGILSPKNVYKQLMVNPKVEVCFYDNNSDWLNAKQMRITGKMEFVNDPKLEKRAAEEGAPIEELVGKPIGHLWKTFRIHSGEAFFFTLKDTLKEQELERVKF